MQEGDQDDSCWGVFAAAHAVGDADGRPIGLDPIDARINFATFAGLVPLGLQSGAAGAGLG